MDRGALWATVHGVSRIRQAFVTKQHHFRKHIIPLQRSFPASDEGFFVPFSDFSKKLHSGRMDIRLFLWQNMAGFQMGSRKVVCRG